MYFPLHKPFFDQEKLCFLVENQENILPRLFIPWIITSLELGCLPIPLSKVKVVPYTFVLRGVPVREDTCPEPSACEVGWPVPFLAALISSVFPPGTHLLLGEQ